MLQIVEVHRRMRVALRVRLVFSGQDIVAASFAKCYGAAFMNSYHMCLG